MRRKHAPKLETMSTMAELNITPLLDLAFVLLIIFMITAPFLAESADLIIPTSKADRDAVDPNQVQLIAINQAREIVLDDESLSTDALLTRLQERFATDPEMAVVIKADRRLFVADLVAVMDIVKNAGITKVGVITKPGDEP